MKKPKLLDQLKNVIRYKHYSIRTEECYVYWAKKFIFFHDKKHPAEMGVEEVSRFLTHLAVHDKVSSSTQNQAFSAILFLYRHVLKMELGLLQNVTRSKKPVKLPVVFTQEEVRSLLTQLEGSKWLMANLLYGAGLRLNECLSLRVKDIDFGYKQIVVRDGKGNKDRVTMLPGFFIEPLQRHLGKVKSMHKRDLKQGFGTVQELLGHKDVSTTMIYTHVLNRGGKGVQSPGDALFASSAGAVS